jgi:hypothetical protein
MDLDGELAPATRGRTQRHLDACAECREWRERLGEEARFYTRYAPEAEVSPALWERTRQAGESSRPDVSARPRAALKTFRPLTSDRGYSAALAVVVLLFFFLMARQRFTFGEAYEVTLNDRRTGATLQRVLKEKDVLNTGPYTAAEISMDDGTVTVEPGTQLRLLRARGGVRRFRLSRGKLHALLWAPARRFFVETPAATAVDLGCSFRLEVDRDGRTLLRVTSGKVALERDGRSVTVSPGEQCLARVKEGPGKPRPSRALGE